MSSDLSRAIADLMWSLQLETRELYVQASVPVVQGAPAPLEFYREYVAPNKPCVIRGAIDHFPALRKWNHAYLRASLAHSNVSVNVTPNGRADAIVAGLFCLPEKRTMTFPVFVDALEEQQRRRGSMPPPVQVLPVHQCAVAAPAAHEQDNVVGCPVCREVFDAEESPVSAVDSASSIVYCSEQNSSFRNEFNPIWHDVDASLEWATTAFGTEPDAVNLWMGDDASTSAIHCDPYENVYAVITGQKHFLLFPPTDSFFMCEREFPVAKYHEDDSRPGSWEIVRDPHGSTNRWIPVNFDDPTDTARFPRAEKIAPFAIRCTVNAGEVLYLPSGWYHQVSQSARPAESCIAINWYGMSSTKSGLHTTY